MKKYTLMVLIMSLFLLPKKSHAQLFGGWILPNSNNCVACNNLGDGSGSSVGNTAISCKQIIECFPSSPDGVYFIDVDGPGGSLTPFKAYCDMTRDGGGWMLISKTKFTAYGPSKIEMTGNAALTGTTDPWSGGTISTASTDLADFTIPTAPNYFPLGYRGNALLTPNDDLSTQAPDELYAILSRDVIEAYRTNSCLSGANAGAKRLKTVIRQTQFTSNFYVQSNKRFNPIQHKCANNLSTTICNSTVTSGCATDFITNTFTSYNPATHIASVIATATLTWNYTCTGGHSNGSVFSTLIPSAWFGGKSSFYDLSYTGTDPNTASTSGSQGIYSQDYNVNWYTACSIDSHCPLTTYWIK